MHGEGNVDRDRHVCSLQGLLKSQELLHGDTASCRAPQLSLITDQHLSVPMRDKCPTDSEQQHYNPSSIPCAARSCWQVTSPLRASVSLVMQRDAGEVHVSSVYQGRGASQQTVWNMEIQSQRPKTDPWPSETLKAWCLKEIQPVLFTYSLVVTFFNYCNSSTAVDFSSEQKSGMSVFRERLHFLTQFVFLHESSYYPTRNEIRSSSSQLKLINVTVRVSSLPWWKTH